jgi:phosphoglycolate phosphatase-like HAD superfamily hydrolase
MKLVIFDIDGTLTQSNDLDDAAFLRALSDVFGLPGVSDDWDGYTHVTDSCILREACQAGIGRAPQPDEIERFQQRFVELLAESARNAGGVPQVAGAGAMLKRLRDSGAYAVAYAGGGWTASALFKIRSAGLPDDIPCAFADEHESREKIMRLARARAEAAYSKLLPDIVYVGDAVWDMRSARRCGYAFVGVGAGPQAEVLRRAGAEWIVADYSDFGAFLAAVETSA